jgi:hypothetical protein
MSTPSLSLVSYHLSCLRTNPSTPSQAHPGGQPRNFPSTGQRVNTHHIPLPSPLHLFMTAVEATSLWGLIILMALTSMGTTSSSSVTRGTTVRAHMRRICTTRRRQHRTQSPGTRVLPFPATQKKAYSRSYRDIDYGRDYGYGYDYDYGYERDRYTLPPPPPPPAGPGGRGYADYERSEYDYDYDYAHKGSYSQPAHLLYAIPAATASTGGADIWADLCAAAMGPCSCSEPTACMEWKM